MELTGNTVVITGGTSGIGRAFAGEFHRLGNKVLICGRREERLKEVAQQFPGIITRVVDVGIEAERNSFSGWIITNHPETNIFINNAGVQYLFNFAKQADITKVRQEVEINLLAPLHFSSLFSAFLAEKHNGAFINISSGLAFVPLAFVPVYCATKAAIHSFTLSLRHQLKDTRVKIFEIAPPAVDTELGSERRTDKTQTHGGMPVEEFLKEAMAALAADRYEAMIGGAVGLREKNEAMFSILNH